MSPPPRYFSRGKVAPPSAESLDVAKQEELWSLSMEAAGIQGSYLGGGRVQG